MTFERIEQPRVADAIVEQLETLILDGVLAPNERLPSERDLAQQLNVSRPSLREAIDVLETRGLIASRHGGGTYVADLLGTAFSAPLIHLFRTHPDCAIDYIEFRAGLEGMAAYLAAQRATDSDRAILTRIFAAMEVAHKLKDPQEEARIDAELHLAVAETSHNIILLHVIRSLFNLLKEGVFYNRNQLYKRRSIRRLLLEQHRAIFEAVVQNRPEEAREAVQGHLNYVRAACRDFNQEAERESVSRRRLDKLEVEERPKRRKRHITRQRIAKA